MFLQSRSILVKALTVITRLCHGSYRQLLKLAGRCMIASSIMSICRFLGCRNFVKPQAGWCWAHKAMLQYRREYVETRCKNNPSLIPAGCKLPKFVRDRWSSSCWRVDQGGQLTQARGLDSGADVVKPSSCLLHPGLSMSLLSLLRLQQEVYQHGCIPVHAPGC